MPVVVAVQVWYWMTNFQNGVVNYVLDQLHLESHHDWYATPFSQLSMVTLLVVWGALPVRRRHGLRRPRAGAARARRGGARSTAPARGAIFRDVTFPVLKPILLILTSLSIIWDFGVFAQPYLLIGSSHVDSTNYLMGVYVFIKGFGAHDFGRGAAISLLMLLMVATLSVFYVRQMVRGRRMTSRVDPTAARAPRAAAGWNCVGLAVVRRDDLPGLLDDLDGLQAGRRHHRLTPKWFPFHPTLKHFRTRSTGPTSGPSEEQPDHRQRHGRGVDHARLPRRGRAGEVPLRRPEGVHRG